jgi:hypothetical protein
MAQFVVQVLDRERAGHFLPFGQDGVRILLHQAEELVYVIVCRYDFDHRPASFSSLC